MHEKSSPFPPNLRLSVMFVGGGAITGSLGWSGYTFALAVTIAFPALWALAPSRAVAILVAFAYFLGASRHLPVGVATFYGSNLTLGLALWLAASLIFAIVHWTLWTPRNGWGRPARYLVCLLVMSVPPLGVVGWASPLTAAGVLFPGWGWPGLMATLGVLCAMTTLRWPFAAIVGAGAFAWSVATWVPPRAPEQWQGVNTSLQFTNADQYAELDRHMKAISQVKVAAKQGAKVVILPESSLGIWTATTDQLWTRELGDLEVTVVAGAIVLDPSGYDNVMVQITRAGSHLLYRQRMPVPVSMWQPLSDGGANAHFFSNPVTTLDGVLLAPLICYEQLLIWPLVHSMLFDAKAIIATGNGWWTGDTSIVSIQKASVEAWASLFGLPLVTAFNH